MNQYFTDFYHNWTEKVQGITGDSLSSIYDKYMTLFVIYNNLYQQIPDQLVARGIVVPDRIYDNKAATEFVVKFLGAEPILSELERCELNEDIETIATLIENEVFHIKIRFGQYNRNDDLKILNELRANNTKKRATAILKVAYHVRCNIFHGNKDFQEYQRMLVEPLIRILSSINPFLYQRLNE